MICPSLRMGLGQKLVRDREVCNPRPREGGDDEERAGLGGGIGFQSARP